MEPDEGPSPTLPNPLDPKWDAKEFFRGLSVYDRMTPHPPAFLKPFLHVMLHIFASGMLNPHKTPPRELLPTMFYIRDRVLVGTETNCYLFNRRVLDAHWSEASIEENNLAEAYLHGYTQLTVAWLRIGSKAYLDSFRNDLVYRGYRYNKCRYKDDNTSYSCPILWRLARFASAGGIDALHALVANPKPLMPGTVTSILEFMAMVRAYWSDEMRMRIIPHLAMAIIASFLVVDRNHIPTYSWKNEAYAKGACNAIMTIYDDKEKKLLNYLDFFTQGLPAFIRRRVACKEAAVIFIGIHKYNRGYMRGLHPLMRQVARIIWQTRRRGEWFPLSYQLQLMCIFG